jgi:hypothetical protein
MHAFGVDDTLQLLALISCCLDVDQFNRAQVVCFWEVLKPSGEASQSLVRSTVCAAVGCVFIACFHAWKDEHVKLSTEIGKNQKPDLRGEIDQVFIGKAVDADGVTPTDGAVVLLAVKVWNTIQMPEFGINKYEMTVTVDDMEGLVMHTGAQGEWTINMKVGDSFRVTQMTRDRLRPMRYIDPQHGSVGFYVKGLSPDATEFKSITLNLVDAIDGKHPITLSNGRFIPNAIVGQRINIL